MFVCWGYTAPHLEVPVHNAQAVQVLQRQNDLCSIESRSIFRKPALGFEVREKLPTCNEIHHQVEVGDVLEMAAQVDDKGVADLSQDTALSTCMRNLAQGVYVFGGLLMVGDMVKYTPPVGFSQGALWRAP